MITIDEAIIRERKLKDEQLENAKIIENFAYIRNSRDKEDMIDSFFSCAEEHEQIAEYLEELKAYREGMKMNCDRLNKALEKWKKVGYNKAIDDFYTLFISEVKNRYPDMPIFNFRLQRSVWEMENAKYIECEEIALKIAEQLKKGGADAGSI